MDTMSSRSGQYASKRKRDLYEDIYCNRFSFGQNWQEFLKKVDERRIAVAEASLKVFLRTQALKGKRFLDLGCGSGLFSLAARNLGAEVVSVDIDEFSLTCTKHLKQRYRKGDQLWDIRKGSALNQRFLQTLGTFDIVYSWGVLHHTGDMWRALDLARRRVKKGGTLYLAIYNRFEGFPSSRCWKRIKQQYSGTRPGIRKVMEAAYVTYYVLGLLVSGRNPVAYIRHYGEGNARGMDFWSDARDWLGGYPYEYASAKEIETFFARRGLSLINLRVTSREGCNEFLFSTGQKGRRGGKRG
jgi:2-polyprenyl-3-methyl-5-hydroxy-6-metoxy-1,4-benzoquinol methylase